MKSRCLQFVVCLMLSISLLAAPCRNCQPKPEAVKQASHDCCPKSKLPQAPSRTCSWQPADFDSTDAKQQVQTVVLLLPAPAILIEAPAPAPDVFFAPAKVDTSPPPLYLTHLALLI
jgi:hypothetical protein